MKCIAVGAEHTAQLHLVRTHHVRRLQAEEAPCNEECTGATKVFGNEFEVCGQCDESRRIAQAQVTLREYGG
jgi:hypothetical protein